MLWLQWKTPISPSSRKRDKSQSNFKIMLIYFNDANGIIHQEFLFIVDNDELTVLFESVIEIVREYVKKLIMYVLCSGEWILHHDNAYDPTILGKKNMEVVT